jgi:hypothetical protein
MKTSWEIAGQNERILISEDLFNITGKEKGHAQIFLGRLFQAFGQSGCLDESGQID